MSFDERMAHYRQKYSGAAKSPETPAGGGAVSASAAPVGAAPRGSGPRRRHGGKGRRPRTQAAAGNGLREDGQQGRKRRDRGGDRIARGGDRIAAGNTGNNAARQNAGARDNTAQKQAAASGKGILNRIMGLFRKKAK
jgi:hypothetical protein